MNKASTIALATTTALFAFSGLAFAQETAQLPAETPAPAGIIPAPVRPNVKAMQVKVQEKRIEIKDSATDIRNTFKVEVKDLRTNTKEQMREATSSAERRVIEKNAIEQRKELMETRKASSTEIRDQKKDLLEARQAEVKDRMKEQARKNVEMIKRRYEIAIKQFDNLSARIQSRIEKMKANGIDTTSAESALALAVTAIAQVKTDAQALADLGAQIQSGDDAKTLRPQIESAVKQLNASVKAAHEALKAAGRALLAASATRKPDTQTEPTSSDTN